MFFQHFQLGLLLLIMLPNYLFTLSEEDQRRLEESELLTSRVRRGDLDLDGALREGRRMDAQRKRRRKDREGKGSGEENGYYGGGKRR
jgi:hypothetical protein